MDPDTLATTSAFGTALMPVGSPSGQADGTQVLPQNPAQVLAALMDFPGSVALAELIEAPASRVPRNPRAHELGERLLDDVRARLDALEPLSVKPLLGRRGPELPTPDQLALALERRGLVPGCSEARIAQLAEDLGAPLREALGTSLRKAQAHVATLRWEIAQDLRLLGPKADQLERLDAALTRSMNAKMGELLDRMEHAAQATFARACAHAIEALGEDRSADALAAWCTEDGWIGRYHERCVRMARALFGHLRRGLEGLVRAAAHAEET